MIREDLIPNVVFCFAFVIFFAFFILAAIKDYKEYRMYERLKERLMKLRDEETANHGSPSKGLSLNEQALLLAIICAQSDYCSMIHIKCLRSCPFNNDCDNVSEDDWLEILKRRDVPEDSQIL